MSLYQVGEVGGIPIHFNTETNKCIANYKDQQYTGYFYDTELWLKKKTMESFDGVFFVKTIKGIKPFKAESRVDDDVNGWTDGIGYETHHIDFLYPYSEANIALFDEAKALLKEAKEKYAEVRHLADKLQK